MRCNRVYEDTVQVKGEINGKKWPVVIDTALSHSLVRPDVLGQSHFHKKASSILGVTKDNGTIHGSVEVSMKITNKVEKISVYILDIEDPFILCLDYLLPNKCSVDPFDMSLTIGVQGKSVSVDVVNSSLVHVSI